MTLRELLNQQNRSYDTIEYRIYCNVPQKKNDIPVYDLTLYNGKLWQDTFFGFCSYDIKTKELKPLDGDSYDLDVQLINWEEQADRLVVWESPDEQIENFEDYQAGYQFAKRKYKKELEKAQKQLVDLADCDAYGDYQLGYRRGLIEAARIIEKIYQL